MVAGGLTHMRYTPSWCWLELLHNRVPIAPLFRAELDILPSSSISSYSVQQNFCTNQRAVQPRHTTATTASVTVARSFALSSMVFLALSVPVRNNTPLSLSLSLSFCAGAKPHSECAHSVLHPPLHSGLCSPSRQAATSRHSHCLLHRAPRHSEQQNCLRGGGAGGRSIE